MLELGHTHYLVGDPIGFRFSGLSGHAQRQLRLYFSWHLLLHQHPTMQLIGSSVAG